jgi:dTDP-4-dehydrorhamnose 3,5-epimerase
LKAHTIPLQGPLLIEPGEFHDDRGFFAYSFDRSKFEALGLPGQIVQSNISFNIKKGTLRGMHFQIAPSAQPKLVRCTSGGIYDVVIDLRPDSPTHRQWFGAELTAGNHHSLYIPTGFAHGFQTLEDASEVLYDMFEWYDPKTGRGVRFDDPQFGILWPLPVSIISDRDRTYPDYQG